MRALAAILVLGLLAGCSSSGGSSAPVESAVTSAPATTSAEVVAAGTCADAAGPDSIQGLTCLWLASADPVVCDRMTGRLLDEVFSGAVESCRLAIERVRAPDDAAGISYAAATIDGDRASLDVEDGPGRTRYAVSFVREDGAWLMDSIENRGRLEGASAGEGSAPEPDPEAEEAVRELALRWYRDVDPAVCDSMTDRMLEFGWEKRGDAGRASCRKNVGAADPLVNVKVRRPLVNGDKARVAVVYTLDGDRLLDRLTFVRVDGEWLIDRVALVGFVP